EQNQPVASGQIGQPPVEAGQQVQQTLSTLGRLVETDQFEQIVLRADAAGREGRIKDIGHVEMTPRSQDVVSRLAGEATVGIAAFQLPDANALSTADRIKAKMEELKRDFPPGVDYKIVYDTTPFVRESVEEVFKTLAAAVVLVALVVIVFL